MGKYWNLLKNWRKQKGVTKWVFRHTKPYLPQLLLLTLLDTVSSLSAIGLAYLTKLILDAATEGQAIASNIIFYIAIALISLAIRFMVSILSVMINEKYAFGIRMQVYDSVLKACYEDVSAYHSGDILTRLTSDIDAVANGVSEVIPNLISMVTSFFVAFFFLMSFDPTFALFVLILGPITAVVTVVAGRISRKVQVKVQESESIYRAEMQESLENMLVLKAFEGQEAAGQRLMEMRNERLRWVRKRQNINAFSNLMLNAVFQFSYIAVFVYGTRMLSLGAITFGTLQLFQSLAGQVQIPFSSMSRMVPRVVSILASSGRIIALENLPEEDMRIPEMGAEPLQLDMEQVSFGYRDDPVLEKASLCIQPGEFVALTGDSGIGKTTLIRLVLAYYTPQAGRIEISTDAQHKAPANAGARHYISYVPQGNTLVSGTIAYNLRTGRADATEAEMWEMLRVVAADDFVRSMPQGLDTRIGERGKGLSEGQAQRIAIARALIKNAPLLILDEATSALDEKTETAVLEHLQRHTPRPTCIIITHRRSILPYCDRCLIIENRRICEVPIESTPMR